MNLIVQGFDELVPGLSDGEAASVIATLNKCGVPFVTCRGPAKNVRGVKRKRARCKVILQGFTPLSRSFRGFVSGPRFVLMTP